MSESNENKIDIMNYHIDDLSMKEAIKYVIYHPNSDFSSKLTILQQLQYQQNLRNSSNSPIPNNELQNDLRIMERFQIHLLVKILLGYIFIYRGKSMLEVSCYILGSIMYYMFEIGILNLILQYFIDKRQRRRNNNVDVNATTAIVPQPAVQRDWIDYLQEMIQQGIHIPQERGFIYDVSALVLGLICSIFPSWNP